jgi:adenine/guanine/hypoxanthine permease
MSDRRRFPSAAGSGMLPRVTEQTEGSRPAKTRASDRTKSTPTPRRNDPRQQGGALDRYFHIHERGSTVERELRGGVVTFFTMAYIIVLNPLILGFAPDVNGHLLGGGSAPNLPAIAAATALVAGLMTILMGVVANYPLALATGLGLNAFLAVSVATQMSWADAMGLIVLEGLIILVLVLTGFRTAVFHAVPAQLKTAISVGIGLFIAFIGFVDAGFTRRTPDDAHTTVPVQLGTGFFLQGWPVLVFCVGLALVVTLWVKRVRGAILIAIIVTTILAIIVESIGNFGSSQDNPTGGWGLNVPQWPDKIADTPHFDTIFHVSLFGSFQSAGVVTALLLIFTLMLADFFDTMGTMTAIGAEAGLLDAEGTPPNPTRILVVDSVAAAAGGAAGVSSNTSYIESASGVGEGARTGLASVVTGILFLLSIFLAPLVSVIPSEAAVPALVLVGFLMMQQVKGISWDDTEIAIPAFLTIVLMPFTYSISVGIGAGFLAYVLIKAVKGKSAQVHPLLWVVAALFLLYFAINPVTALLT